MRARGVKLLKNRTIQAVSTIILGFLLVLSGCLSQEDVFYGDEVQISTSPQAMDFHTSVVVDTINLREGWFRTIEVKDVCEQNSGSTAGGSNGASYTGNIIQDSVKTLHYFAWVQGGALFWDAGDCEADFYEGGHSFPGTWKNPQEDIELPDWYNPGDSCLQVIANRDSSAESTDNGETGGETSIPTQEENAGSNGIPGLSADSLETPPFYAHESWSPRDSAGSYTLKLQISNQTMETFLSYRSFCSASWPDPSWMAVLDSADKLEGEQENCAQWTLEFAPDDTTNNQASLILDFLDPSTSEAHYRFRFDGQTCTLTRTPNALSSDVCLAANGDSFRGSSPEEDFRWCVIGTGFYMGSF